MHGCRGRKRAVALRVEPLRVEPRMQPGTPLLQRLLHPLLVSLRQLNASVERVEHTLELVEGHERLQSARGGIDMNGWET